MERFRWQDGSKLDAQARSTDSSGMSSLVVAYSEFVANFCRLLLCMVLCLQRSAWNLESVG
ncbi:hypothetical protein DV515_00004237, partial [Chloebia gouldiae]